MAPMERLQKVMAQAGGASRRHSEELILRGHVRVNGDVVRELGYKMDTLTGELQVMGKRVDLKAPRTYLMLNKPVGYLTTVSDPFRRETVIDLVADKAQGVYPVGRLDMDSEGLLILTNDGELAFRLTHPKHKVPKKYLVDVRGRPTVKGIWKLRQGVRLEDGITRPATVRLISKDDEMTRLEIVLSEGRKRQLRRMCQAIGHPVIKLQRLAVGPLLLQGLEPGASRVLTEREVAELKAAVDL